MRPHDRYVIRGGAQGRERLRLLSTVMGARSRAFLEAAGVRRGDRCVDIGCGGGDVAFELAEIVGADGSVLGVDLGGLVIVEDVDFRGHFAEPPCPALDRYVSLYSDSLRRRGGDPDIGPRLPALLRDAGFQDVQVRMHQPIAMTGGIKSLTGMTFAFVADALRADGVPESELAAIGRQLTDFLDDPRTVHGGPRVIQCWGRAPH